MLKYSSIDVNLISCIEAVFTNKKIFKLSRSKQSIVEIKITLTSFLFKAYFRCFSVSA